MVWIDLERERKKSRKVPTGLKCDCWSITCIITAVRGVCFHFVDRTLKKLHYQEALVGLAYSEVKKS